ncbi:cytochrome P450 [Roseobacter sinensis]|uniref:Cytochrome P450 n=1 Tax=Roseobacter sinensis TaxID=2931391 RepID=A0ABT3BDE3_9RHOB|nr:cytochrome P450 [Roseobacter sp. WL0113]MCV3271597.1 cytochrome P450 [Roseobacter sp. WL0113]
MGHHPPWTINDRRLPVRVPLTHEKLGVLRSFNMMRENVLNIIPEIATRQAVVSGRTARRWHMIMHPPSIRQMLLDRVEDYPKSVVTKNLLRPAVGDSLFIAEGQHWRWQRRLAAPAFSHRNVRNLAPVMTAAAERSAERIADAGRRAVNLLDEMIAATFDVISEVTFSDDGSFDRGDIHRAIEDYVADAGRVSLLDVLGAPDWLPRPARVFSAQSMAEMRRSADAAIDARAARGPGPVPDFLDLLLAGEDPKSKRKLTTSELRDNLLTFIVAGHETTALSLAWSFYLCAFDPEVQERARAEAHSVLQGRAATGDDIDQLPFIRQIIDEALRLYPPAGVVSRTAQKADNLHGADIRPGDTVMIPIYALGRHKQLWEDPDTFNPDRFADRKAIDRYAYLPFGDGPRICIGASFALQEAVIILATLLSRFRFTPVAGRDPKPVMILTLRPEGGVWLMAEPV